MISTWILDVKELCFSTRTMTARFKFGNNRTLTRPFAFPVTLEVSMHDASATKPHLGTFARHLHTNQHLAMLCFIVHNSFHSSYTISSLLINPPRRHHLLSTSGIDSTANCCCHLSVNAAWRCHLSATAHCCCHLLARQDSPAWLQTAFKGCLDRIWHVPGHDKATVARFSLARVAVFWTVARRRSATCGRHDDLKTVRNDICLTFTHRSTKVCAALCYILFLNRYNILSIS